MSQRLLAEKKKLESRISEIHRTLQENANKKHLPKMRKEYNNTYYKCPNGYDGGETWWMYIYVEKVDRVIGYPNGTVSGMGRGWYFQKMPNGTVEIQRSETIDLKGHLTQTKINQKVFFNQFYKILSELEELPGYIMTS